MGGTHGVATDRGASFLEQSDRLLEARGFDAWVERQCACFHAERMGRPSLAPGLYLRLLLIGYFEGIDSERGIAWGAEPRRPINQRFLTGALPLNRRRCSAYG